MIDQPETTPVPLHKIDSKAIRTAFGRMPYWPLARKRLPDGDLTVGDVVEAIDALADVLKRHGERDSEQERELYELRGQRRAIRAFLGIDA